MHTTLEPTQLRLQSLIEINQLFISTVEPDEVLTVILDAALRLCVVQGCSLAWLDDTIQHLTFVAMAGPAKVEEFRGPLGQGSAGWVARTGQGVVCNDVSQDAGFFRGIDRQTGCTTQSILCAPLKQRNQLIGVIEALHTTRPNGFTTEDLELLAAFGGLAGTAINPHPGICPSTQCWGSAAGGRAGSLPLGQRYQSSHTVGPHCCRHQHDCVVVRRKWHRQGGCGTNAPLHHFLDHYCREMSRPTRGITPAAMALLQAYHWPGNVRELQNVIERGVVLSSGPDIMESDFPAELRQTVPIPGETFDYFGSIDATLFLAEAVNVFKRSRVRQALEVAGGNQSLAAKRLGVQPSNLSRLMHTLGLR
jgi:transcriptional regulator with GAF, ATPase, and Fis domain